MSFTFTEDTIKKGSAPFKSGVYDMVIEQFYIGERESKTTGNKYFNVNLVLVEVETDRKLFLSGFNSIYGGSIDDNGRWNFKTKDGKKDQRSVEFINTFLFLAGLPTFAGTDIQDKVTFTPSKAKEYNTDVDVLTIKELIGKPISIGIKMVEDGYEDREKQEWVEQIKPTIEAIFDTATRKTASEKSRNVPANFITEFEKAFPEDFVEELWDKDKVALRDKLQAFAGADTSVGAEDTDTTSSTAPASTDALAGVL